MLTALIRTLARIAALLCASALLAAHAANYSDLWWNPDESGVFGSVRPDFDADLLFWFRGNDPAVVRLNLLSNVSDTVTGQGNRLVRGTLREDPDDTEHHVLRGEFSCVTCYRDNCPPP